jgi:hypothetical protein
MWNALTLQFTVCSTDAGNDIKSEGVVFKLTELKSTLLRQRGFLQHLEKIRTKPRHFTAQRRAYAKEHRLRRRLEHSS